MFSAGDLMEPINPEYVPPALTTTYEVETQREGGEWRVATRHRRIEEAEWASERIASRGKKTRVFRVETIRVQV